MTLNTQFIHRPEDGSNPDFTPSHATRWGYAITGAFNSGSWELLGVANKMYQMVLELERQGVAIPMPPDDVWKYGHARIEGDRS